MAVLVIPSRPSIAIMLAIVVAVTAMLIAGVPVDRMAMPAAAVAAAFFVAMLADYLLTKRAWRASAPAMTRGLPAAFAIGVPKPVTLSIAVTGASTWQCSLFDHAPSSLATEGLPLQLTLAGGTATEAAYQVVPTLRGDVQFAP